MKLETISRKTVSIGLLIILLCFAGGTIAWASIPQNQIRCQGCHVQPGGGVLLTQYAGNQGCIYCHSSSEYSTTYELDLGGGMGQKVTVPVVVYTETSAPTSYLDGGNFWWVKGPATGDPEGPNYWTGGQDDTKGHNIFPGEGDDYLASAPGVVYGSSCGGPSGNSCHDNLNNESYQVAYPGVHEKWGCTSCHGVYNFVAPEHMHHADDSNTVVGSDPDDDDAFFRFLMGHGSGEGMGVCGIEDDDWGATSSSTDHNEYLGSSVYKDAPTQIGGSNAAGHTVTGFCGGCHGNFHISSDFPTGGDWIRHVAGGVLPDSGEFASYTNFDADTPVARPDFTDWTGPSSTVTPGTDLVNCLSCHRAHGSPYPKMLRWDLNGCKKCHISK